MAPPARAPIALGPIVGASLVGAAVAGIVAWQISLGALTVQIEQKRAGLKKLTVTGKIPPNEEVSGYLKTRQGQLDAQYRYWVDRVTAPPLTAAAAADPQLFFQEQVHGLQRTLERLATARNAKTPEQLGFPKELPPPDTVPRLLAQLSLLETIAELAYERNISDLSALKLDDPEPLPSPDGEGAYLTRVPVRARLSGSLAQLVDLMAVLQRQKPLIDVRGVRFTRSDTPGRLDAELILARYLAAPAASTAATPPVAARNGADRAKPSRTGRTP